MLVTRKLEKIFTGKNEKCLNRSKELTRIFDNAKTVAGTVCSAQGAFADLQSYI